MPRWITTAALPTVGGGDETMGGGTTADDKENVMETNNGASGGSVRALFTFTIIALGSTVTALSM